MAPYQHTRAEARGTVGCGTKHQIKSLNGLSQRRASDRGYRTRPADREGEEVRFASDSPLEGNGFELPVRGRGQSDVAPLCRRVLGMGRCALSAFGQHDALHQSGVDPTAEAAIRAGDAQRRLLRGPGSCGGRLQQTQILRCRRVLESAKLGYARRSD